MGVHRDFPVCLFRKMLIESFSSVTYPTLLHVKIPKHKTVFCVVVDIHSWSRETQNQEQSGDGQLSPRGTQEHEFGAHNRVSVLVTVYPSVLVNIDTKRLVRHGGSDIQKTTKTATEQNEAPLLKSEHRLSFTDRELLSWKWIGWTWFYTLLAPVI